MTGCTKAFSAVVEVTGEVAALVAVIGYQSYICRDAPALGERPVWLGASFVRCEPVPLAIGAVALAYVLVAARTRVDEVDDVRRAVGAVTGRLGTISRLQRSQRRRRNQ